MSSNKKILIFVAILLGVPFLWLGFKITTTIMDNGVIPKKFEKKCYTVAEVSKMRAEYSQNHGSEEGFNLDKPECPPPTITPFTIMNDIL